MQLSIQSELGRLRRVLVHRPGLEIDRMSPSLMERLLFDDILDGEQARAEHALFCDVLRHGGVEVLDAQELLATTLDDDGDVRDALFERLADRSPVSGKLPTELLAELAELPGEELAAALIAGVRAEDGRFRLDPIPNYFFQRDCQVVLGERVLIPAMATPAREREPLLARTFFEHHPDFAGTAVLDLGVAPPGADGAEDARHSTAFPYPTLEGGDVLVPSPEVLLVGVSERTNRWGVEYLAEHLRRVDTGFRHLVVVEIPGRRSFMHLDTVFTFIDRGVCLGYRPVIEPGNPESAHVHTVDLAARELAFVVRPSLTAALAEHGIEIEIVPCGGGGDPLDQEREQWTDGANAFAMAPGVIFLYRRNRRTLDELDRRGWRVLMEEEALGQPLVGAGPTAIALRSNELSRARGGPRCMTMPLVREPL